MRLATEQHGVVSTRQLAQMGYSPSSAAKAARVARLHRLHRGVYAVGHGRLTWHSRCLAAVLAAEPEEEAPWRAVASHTSAAWLWGLLRYRPEAIHVTAPSRRRASREFTVHFSSCLADEDRAARDGIAVTSLARTLLDLAASSPRSRLERYLERAEERGVFDLPAVESVLLRAGRHRGRGPLRHALAIYRPEAAFTRSSLERQFLALVRDARLPTPAMNFVVAGYELDAYWQQERFAVELDAYETHGSRAAFERDRLRQEDLKLIGVETVRMTGARIRRDPAGAMERLAALLSRRRVSLP